MRNKHNGVVSGYINSQFNSTSSKGRTCVQHQSSLGVWVSAALCWAWQIPVSSPDLTWRVRVCRKTNSFIMISSHMASRKKHFGHALWVELYLLMTVSRASALFTFQFFTCVCFKYRWFSLSCFPSSSCYNKSSEVRDQDKKIALVKKQSKEQKEGKLWVFTQKGRHHTSKVLALPIFYSWLSSWGQKCSPDARNHGALPWLLSISFSWEGGRIIRNGLYS